MKTPAGCRRYQEIVAQQDGGPSSSRKIKWSGGKGGAPCVHRLVARASVRDHVSGAQLQLVAYAGGAQNGILPLVASRGDGTGAAVHFSGGRFVGDGNPAVARKRSGAESHCANGDFARRGNSWVGLPLSRAGICFGLSQRTVDGFVARRRPEYLGNVDHVYGDVDLG